MRRGLVALVLVGTAWARGAVARPEAPPPAAGQAAGPEALGGRLVPRVACRDDPRWSYAAYLPSSYAPERTWPILYVFDARGRGGLAAELFREAAERWGVVVASSNDTRSDDPEAPNDQAVQALWNDTHQRFRIDMRRRYAAGFSGGARLACRLGLAPGRLLAGVVGVGGGLPPEATPGPDLPFAFYGVVGETDFNYYELRALDAALARAGVAHRLEVVPGGHAWPEPAAAGRALRWLELRSVAQGLRADPDGLVEAHRSDWETRARDLEGRGLVAEALEAWSALAEDLRGVGDPGPAAAAAARLRRGGAERERRRREKLDEHDRRYLAKLPGIYREIASAPLTAFPAILRELDVPHLVAEAEKNKGTFEGASASRRLANVLVQTSFYLPATFWKRGDDAQALLSLRVAAEIAPDSPRVQYDLACAWARTGSSREALRALAAAVHAGYADAEAARADPDLASLRGSEEFERILAPLASRP